jgi:hypothetical protein
MISSPHHFFTKGKKKSSSSSKGNLHLATSDLDQETLVEYDIEDEVGGLDSSGNGKAIKCLHKIHTNTF